jgi:hypothetical protein
MLLSEMRRTTTALVLAASVAALLAGCADNAVPVPADSSPSGPAASGTPTGSPAPTAAPTSPAGSPTAPGLSSTALPTPHRPGGPPKTPSDMFTGTAVVGTVTAGGSGPCYGLVTDDGVEYALHSNAGTTLIRGTRIRIQTAPLNLKIDCGPGHLVSMTKSEPIR